MGCLRLFLAFAVVAAHTLRAGNMSFILPGNLAVKLFFVVSGFYMAMILAEKYNQPGWTGLRLFYSNRALRIYPLLWVTLALELATAWLVPMTLGSQWSVWPGLLSWLYEQERLASIASLAAAQISGFGVDAVHLFSFNSIGVASWYDGPVANGSVRGWSTMPMSHAWSISCELVFYLAAPFLGRLKTPALISTAIASTLIALFFGRIVNQPELAEVASSFWAPLQFGYFILGILAYRLFKSSMWCRVTKSSCAQLGITIGFGFLILLYGFWNRFSYTATLVFLFGAAVVAIPILFARSSRFHWDRVLGNLSYPVYLVHISVIRLLELSSVKSVLGDHFFGTLQHAGLVMTLSVGFSWLLVKILDQKIDNYRQRRLSLVLANRA
ncbi:MAG: acyltransferase [Prosthecobacter sp.]